MKILENRDGTNYEDIAAIDSKTGKVIAYNSNSLHEGKSGFTKEQYELIRNHGSKITLIHNHPNSSRLSYKDISTLFKYDFLDGEISIGHDGSIYYAHSAKKEFDIDTYYDSVYNEFKEEYGSMLAKLYATDVLYETGFFKVESR